MISYILVGLACLSAGVFFGGRLMLARQRLREIRTMLVRNRSGESLEQVFALSLRQRQQFESANMVHHVKVVNALQFVILWNWDLVVLLASLQDTHEAWSKGWSRKLQARVLALTIYESLIRLKDFLDKDWSRKWSLRRALQALKVDDTVAPELERLHSRLVELLDRHHQLLEGVRNNAIGHRDQDVSRQIEWVKNADLTQLVNLGWELITWTTEVIHCLTDALQELQRATSLGRVRY